LFDLGLGFAENIGDESNGGGVSGAVSVVGLVQPEVWDFNGNNIALKYDPATYDQGYASNQSRTGVIAGALHMIGTPYWQPCVWANDSVLPTILPLPGSYVTGSVFNISGDSTTVVGSYQTAAQYLAGVNAMGYPNAQDAFAFYSGAYNTLNNPSVSCVALDITDTGQPNAAASNVSRIVGVDVTNGIGGYWTSRLGTGYDNFTDPSVQAGIPTNQMNSLTSISGDGTIIGGQNKGTSNAAYLYDTTTPFLGDYGHVFVNINVPVLFPNDDHSTVRDISDSATSGDIVGGVLAGQNDAIVGKSWNHLTPSTTHGFRYGLDPVINPVTPGAIGIRTWLVSNGDGNVPNYITTDSDIASGLGVSTRGGAVCGQLQDGDAYVANTFAIPVPPLPPVPGLPLPLER
jgi:hypothetical protein